MPIPKKSLTLFSLLLIFFLTNDSDAFQPEDRNHLQGIRRRIEQRSVGVKPYTMLLNARLVKKDIARRSYDLDIIASLLDQSLSRVILTSRSHPGSSLPQRYGPAGPSPGFKSAQVSGVDPKILNRIDRYDTQILKHSRELGIDPNLTRAIIYVESAGRPHAVSPQGAKGLMQLLPSTAADLGIHNLFDPGQNIRAGTRYLRILLNRFRNVKLALWGYNAGPGSVKRNKFPLETRRYIPKVLRVKAVLDRIQGKTVKTQTQS